MRRWGSVRLISACCLTSSCRDLDTFPKSHGRAIRRSTLVRQLAAALDDTSLLVLDSAILEPGSKLPGSKAQASLRTPKQQEMCPSLWSGLTAGSPPVCSSMTMHRAFTQLSPFLWVVQSRTFSYNSGIVISGGDALLIDPGMFPDEIDEIRRFVVNEDVALTSVILTHSHWDHILGPERLAGARVIMQLAQANASPRQRAGTIQEIEHWEEENGIKRDRPFVTPVPDQTFDHDLIVHLGELDLQLMHAPGHWPDELVVYHAESGTLWAGDMLSDIEIPYVSHSLAAYEQTLAMLDQLDIRALVPGHGSATTDARDIKSRLRADSVYLSELRQVVQKWIAGGGLPEMRRSLIVQGFTSSPKLEASLYPHRLNIQTAAKELGGMADAAPGWRSD